MGKHYVGEIGTEFLLDCGVDVSDGVTLYMKYKTPGAVTGTWTASLYSSYSLLAEAIGTYFLRHVIAGTEFSVSGDWHFQAVVGNTAGTWYGESVKETIFGEFE